LLLPGVRGARVMLEAPKGTCGVGCSPLPVSARGLYGSLVEFSRTLDRVVDIMNARSERGAGPIDSPHSPLIHEALELLVWFCEWKSDLEAHGEDLEVAFLHHTTWEDINGLLLGVACTARFNLAMFPDEALVQRRLDQDPCEHHFNHLRQGGGATSNITASRACGLSAIAGTLHSAAMGGRAGNSGQATRTLAEAMEPLPRASRRP
jgi:hypothetical protein